MLHKWNEKEDIELAKLVKKYGTSDWNTIRKYFKSNRSRDSVIKRWHGKLKYQDPAPVEVVQKTKKINKEISATAIRIKARLSRSGNQKFRKTRSTTGRVLQSNKNNRFKRLRKILQGTKTARNRKLKQAKQLKQKSQKEQAQSQKNGQIKQNSDSSANIMIWHKNDDTKLRSLIINQGIMKWQKIASMIGCSENDAKERWRNNIYNTIKLDDKVGGFLKYSAEQDNILTLGNKNGLSWEDLMAFLPGRSQFSIEARWRRLVRPELEIELSKNKHYIMRQFMKKIVQKRQNTQQPLQEPLQLQASLKNS